MTEAPERIWITKEESVIGEQRSFRASNLDHGDDWLQYVRADKVQALVEALDMMLRGVITYAPEYMHGIPKREYVDTAEGAISAFTDGGMQG